VKQLAAEDALLKAKAKKRQIDIKFSILGSAYNLATGYEGSLWVKQLAAEDALLKAKARKRQVDIEFPILGSVYKAQKSKNSRDLEGKKEFIEEAIKG